MLSEALCAYGLHTLVYRYMRIVAYTPLSWQAVSLPWHRVADRCTLRITEYRYVYVFLLYNRNVILRCYNANKTPCYTASCAVRIPSTLPSIFASTPAYLFALSVGSIFNMWYTLTNRVFSLILTSAFRSPIKKMRINSVQ
jgi:hypothetical protein